MKPWPEHEQEALTLFFFFPNQVAQAQMLDSQARHYLVTSVTVSKEEPQPAALEAASDPESRRKPPEKDRRLCHLERRGGGGTVHAILGSSGSWVAQQKPRPRGTSSALMQTPAQRAGLARGPHDTLGLLLYVQSGGAPVPRLDF